ncbi:uncharacterized protein [Clytia hemisphaerica]|uniref:Cnidarian restricted protein n=1 Tax=Clytia hemisphaerica TaxID=252671 RepID=A0A7M6DMM1_9CNID
MTKMHIQMVLKWFTILLLFLNKDSDCSELYEKTEQLQFHLKMGKIAKGSISLVQCLLMCSVHECDVVGYLPLVEACILYEESKQMMIFDEDDGIDLYVPRKMQKFKATRTFKAKTMSCVDQYHIGGNCSVIIDPKVILDETCKEADPNRPIAIFQVINGNFLWRCHNVNTLSADHLFYVNGSDYDESMNYRLLTLIDNHPYYKDSHFILSVLISCTMKCTKIGRTCQPTFTANSIYPFYKAGKICNNNKIDVTHDGASFWHIDAEPLVSPDQCKGFINVEAFSCESTAPPGEDRLCRCT